jgi:hypothetical protein
VDIRSSFVVAEHRLSVTQNSFFHPVPYRQSKCSVMAYYLSAFTFTANVWSIKPLISFLGNVPFNILETVLKCSLCVCCINILRAYTGIVLKNAGRKNVDKDILYLLHGAWSVFRISADHYIPRHIYIYGTRCFIPCSQKPASVALF